MEKEEKTLNGTRGWMRKADALLADPLVILLAVIAVAVGALAAYRSIFGATLSTTHDEWGQFGDFLGGILNPVIGFFTLVAILITLRQNNDLVRSAHKQAEAAHTEQQIAHSKEALSAALVGLEAAVDLLEGAGNNRVKWISAARLLSTALGLREAITQDSHLRMFDIHVEQYRCRVGDVLGYNNPKKGPSFFYGSPLDAEGLCEVDVDQAAKDSTKGGKDDLSIDLATLWPLWEFAQYPEEYQDPLKGHGFGSIAGSNTKAIIWPGLWAYVKHRLEFSSHLGKLVKRPKPPTGTNSEDDAPEDG